MKKEKLKLLDLTYDVTFKAFMMSPATSGLKARFIHLITGIDENLLQKAKYQSVELPTKHMKDKTYKTDIIVQIDNHILSLEMNAIYYPEVKIKNTQYMHVLASESFERGEKYENRLIIQINIDNYDAYGFHELIYEFRIMEMKHLVLENENYIKYHINLCKLEENCYNEEKELINILRIFKIRKEEELEKLRGEEYMDEAIDEIKRICRDENIIGLYNAEVVAKKEMNNRLDYAEKCGIEKGIEQEKLQIARNMLKETTDIPFIMRVIGLTKEQIEGLK